MGDEMTRMFRRFGPMALLLAGVLGLASAGLGVDAARAAANSALDNMSLPDNELIEAARDGDVPGIRNAIMHGLTPDDGGIDGTPALIVATERGHLDAVKYLLEKGAHPNHKDRDGRTALAAAAQSGRADIARALLDGGASPNLVAQNKDTPLLIAVRAHRVGVVQVLLAHNVDVEDTDVTGRTALDVAEEHNFNDIASLLRAAESRAGGD
jgi:ankyrin repeat protein